MVIAQILHPNVKKGQWPIFSKHSRQLFHSNLRHFEAAGRHHGLVGLETVA